MEEPKPYVVDKSKWPTGPWNQEPDRIDFEHAGLPCLMLRGERHGAWCGYAAVPPGHPLHGKDYSDEAAAHLEAHGGLTYSDKCGGGICHVPKPGEPDDVWWFGFDCLHSGDVAPGYDFTHGYDSYRDVRYVRRQTERLARQLANTSP